jgi:hypothetical protein
LNTPPASDANKLQVILATPDKQADIITDSCVIPNTAPGQIFIKPQAWVIPDTIPMPVRPERPLPKPANNMEQFSELLESAKNNNDDKRNRRSLFKRDRIPTLEFLDVSNINTSIREESPAAPSTPLTKRGPILDPAKRFLAQQNNLVVVDTPQKDEDTSLDSFRELNSTLHKSANRAEFVDSRVLDNSNYNSRFEGFNLTENGSRYSNRYSINATMPYEHTDINETTFGEDLKGAEKSGVGKKRSVSGNIGLGPEKTSEVATTEDPMPSDRLVLGYSLVKRHCV